MNASKRFTLLTIGIILVLPILTGCFGVGEDDPFISFITRKNRVVAEWKINSDIQTVEQNLGPTKPRENVETKSDTKNWTQKIVIKGADGKDSTLIHSGTVKYESNYLKFDKSGGFIKVYNYEYIDTKELGEEGDAIKERHTCEESIRGTWNFLGGVEDDYKNKERLVLNLESRDFKETVDTMLLLVEGEEGATPIWKTKSVVREVQSYKNGEKTEVYILKKLANKEIQMYQNIKTKEDVIITFPTRLEVSATIEGKREIILKR